ncbi:WecB/TagA/CpsF family glycosyltransferase [Planococcus salinarum]|uniref:WecB/TagA/CpsF family glycosyltransferase n=1 Tax=Planococcus salinarum TaxID=622695 RepID=UPI00163D5879|nr:WecB/TagA/CpsF family glycosyltransferase [Planococcus salinarum]
MLNMNREIWNFDEKCFRNIGNIKIVAASKNEILEELRFRLATQMKTRIFFLNVHCFNVAQKNSGYLRNLNAAEFVLNDGIGAGARSLDPSMKENLDHTDFTTDVLEILNAEKMSLYLLGGFPGVAGKAADNIMDNFPDIILSGTSQGSFENPVDVLKDINQVKPDLLLVGMDVPDQENWISAHFEELDATLIMAVGDYLESAAGRIRQPPLPPLFSRMGMAWAYRLYFQSERLFKNYVIEKGIFLIHLFKLKKL